MSKNKNWLDYYGLSVNSEWMILKILEVKYEVLEIFRRVWYIMEVGDYIISILINLNIWLNCGIGFKGFWDNEVGFNYDFFYSVDFDLFKIVKEKCEVLIILIGESVGCLCKDY